MDFVWAWKPSMHPKHLQIRRMTRADLDVAIEWAATEGWNPGINDAECFFAADPNGFLVGTIDQESVASISAVRYGESFGFLGLYIVKPEFRGSGCGLEIWNAGMAYLDGRCIGLDGVVEQQDNYRKSGFEFAHNNVRYRGVGDGVSHRDDDIVEAASIDFNAIAEYDSQFFPDDRLQFLRKWLTQSQSTVLAIIRNQTIVGYGMRRTCRTGHKIGPLFADSLELANRLLASLKSNVNAGSPFFLDVPATNIKAVEMAQQQDMEVVFETARMYSGAVPDMPLDRIYGITSFELG
jgi:ribosomal protein S18 acetylase RimI-like enzyme